MTPHHRLRAIIEERDRIRLLPEIETPPPRLWWWLLLPAALLAVIAFCAAVWAWRLI